MQVAQFLTEQLIRWGVKRIYGVAGDGIFAWLDQIAKQSDIQYIACKHESAAAMMASAEAKLTGIPAVCTATMGPGFVNLLNGLADAHTDRAPVIAITGQVETYKLGGAYKQFISQEDMIRPISFYSTTITHPDAIQSVLHKAFVTAMQQKGVTHLSICKDVFTQSTSDAVLPALPRIPHAIYPDRMEIELACEQVAKAQKPLILLGIGARKLADSCVKLAEQLGAGVLLSLGAKGAVDESHPLVIGGWGEGGSETTLHALAEADLLLILGASWFPRAFLPKKLSVIQVDHQPGSIHAHPYLQSVTAELDDVLPIWMRRLQSRRQDDAWQEQIKRWHGEFGEETEQAVIQQVSEQVKPQTLMHTLGGVVNEDAIIVLDTGEHTIWFNRAFRGKKQTPLFSGKWRTMGFGLPAAVAAKLTYPEKQVVCVAGDGGLQMNLAELMTAAELQLPIVILVVNNGTLGLEEVKMSQAGLIPFGVKLRNPDFQQLANACGISGKVVKEVHTLESVLREALAADQLTLVDIHCTSPTLTERKKQISFQAQA
ncbi:thiamine pyrophosphate-binding protein [Brevibacillus sp. HB1.1]|uniref:thiamine pyrophosphate-binding protein n=1 Tax=Brevibacillus sp. HB1.1 TaxID=2738808 RepID=UPI001576EBD5|nr:thiamine pyrophosphate-binding protein [Brevibacillus sp. HB1.1]NTU30296.1 thiamine pyrophosphate-binding protein [Brevibacillus sp. HB1.1]